MSYHDCDCPVVIPSVIIIPTCPCSSITTTIITYYYNHLLLPSPPCNITTTTILTTILTTTTLLTPHYSFLTPFPHSSPPISSFLTPHYSFLTPHYSFLTLFPHSLDLATDRGAFIDQSQSLNAFLSNPNYDKLTAMHFYGWKQGLKTGGDYR